MAESNDIFGYKRQKPKGVFSSDLATLNISNTTIQGMLVQNWNFQYSHDVQEIYEIGSSNLYWVKGHPVGQGQLLESMWCCLPLPQIMLAKDQTDSQ